MATAAAATRHRLHTLTVRHIADVGEDALALEFDVPDSLRAVFEFLPGQHVAIASPAVDAVRRSYSICSPAGGPLRVGIKVLPGGRFSTHVQREVTAGSPLDVLPPAGRFVTTIDAARERRVVAIAAGSGITPVYSILASVLAGEPGSRCTLIYGNRTTASTMFLDDVADLKDRYPERFQLFHVLSRESQGAALLEGRIDTPKLRDFCGLIDVQGVSDWYLCGPLPMIDGAMRALEDLGVARSRLHRELFHADTTPVLSRAAAFDGAEVTVVLDGRTSRFSMPPDAASILEAALAVRPDAPYACKGGVCGTCRCRLVEGDVEMARRYALEDDELDAGVRLACQSMPRTEHVVLDFDAV